MHCIYFKEEKDPRKALQKPWNCEPSTCTPSMYCPHRVDTKKLKRLWAAALNPFVEIPRKGIRRRPEEGDYSPTEMTKYGYKDANYGS